MKVLTKRLLALGVTGAIAVTGGYMVGPWEGVETKAYQDIVGVWTICYGETKNVKPGMTKTNEECEQSLASELASYNKAVLKSVKVPLKPYEEIAYTSLAWNIGQGAFSNSTLVKKHNSGDVVGACREILKWNRATFSPKSAQTQIKNGEHCSLKKDGNFSCTVKGLTNRRMHEYRVCIGEDSEVNNALQALNAGEKPSIALEKEGEGVGLGSLEIEDPASYSPAIEVPAVPEVGACKWEFFNICLKRE